MDVLIAGGGTGGHLFPGIALAQEVRRRDPNARIVFVGSPRGIEKHAVPKAGFDLRLIPVSGLRSKGLKERLIGLMRLPVAMVQAFWVVARFRPDVAVSCGGYAAGPAVLAARILGVPCIVMEQNAVPGVTNRILGKVAHRVISALPVKGFSPEKVRVLGNPVRSDLLRVRDTGYTMSETPQILLFGGSQGARALNEAMMELAPVLDQEGLNVRIVHQTGRLDYERVKEHYKTLGIERIEARQFIDDMASEYEAADLVICRAGATTIAELTVVGRPSILVPFPFAVDDHQTANALELENQGAALHLPQTELSAQKLLELLKGFLADSGKLKTMAQASFDAGRPDAVSQIFDALKEEIKHV